MDCSICQEPATAATGQATLSCGHGFHVGCIAGWLVAGGPKSCPNCRNPFGPFEQLPAAFARDDETLSYQPEDDSFDEQIPEPPTLQMPPILSPLLTSALNPSATIQLQYAAPIAPYIFDVANKTGVHYLPAYAKVFTSLLTIQAAVRGHLTRQALRAIRST